MVFFIRMYTFLGGEGQIFCEGSFHGAIFHGVRSSEGVNLSGEIIHCGNFSAFFHRIHFMCLAFLFRLNFARGVTLLCTRLIFSGIELSRGYFHGEGVSLWRRARFSGTI